MEPNFRYTGARLAHAIEEESPFFRCELALLCREQVKENGDNPDILMFLADLYSQFQCGTYAELVIECISNVLSTETEGHIKPVCQALKVLCVFCGQDIRTTVFLFWLQLIARQLEEANREAVNVIFNKLMEIKSRLSNQRLMNIIDSVIALRLNNWGEGQVKDTNSVTQNWYVLIRLANVLFIAIISVNLDSASKTVTVSYISDPTGSNWPRRRRSSCSRAVRRSRNRKSKSASLNTNKCG